MGIAKRRHIHAQQLEFGTHIRAGEALLLTRQHSGGHARHLVARGHQPKIFPSHSAHSPMASTSGSEVRQPSSIQIPPRSPITSPLLRQRVLRTNTGREDHHVRFQLFTIGKAQHQPVVCGGNLRRRFTGVPLRPAPQFSCAALPRRRCRAAPPSGSAQTHHVSFQPELLKCIRRLQTQQAAATTTPRREPAAWAAMLSRSSRVR